MAMLATLRHHWSRLPKRVRQPVVRTGLPYAASFLSSYSERHRIANFAGNLEELKVAYSDTRAEARAELSRQFDSVVDALVMPNDVKKTTYANRVTRSLSAVLSAVQLPNSEIHVLDLPASTGVASLQSLTVLREKYRVTSYVLGDKYHRILYDRRRRCIFDEHGHLLQVAFRKYYFSVYRGHASGDEHTFLSKCLLFPHSVMAWYLRKRYGFKLGREYRQLLVVHPEVEKLLDQGIFHLQEMDIFQPIPGCYELILSFNLLQRNYFPPDTIKAGVDNLTASLSEGGVLILGNTESFLALQKQNGSIIPCLHEGSF
jgi:hypothetical protein